MGPSNTRPPAGAGPGRARPRQGNQSVKHGKKNDLSCEASERGRGSELEGAKCRKGESGAAVTGEDAHVESIQQMYVMPA
eukprot:746644-Hanusia_phi.AAC.1